jgi:hypothetical protein
MLKPIRIAISAANGNGSDAPTADDFLGQVRDVLDVLRGVEKAASDDGGNEIVWRVTNAQMNSPIWVELTPYATDPAIFVGDRAEKTERAFLEGIVAISGGGDRPRYFNDDLMKTGQRLYDRVRNGLTDTIITFDKFISERPVIIDHAAARKVEIARIAALAPVPIPYWELGSIEGFVSKAELDGFGRAILRIRTRLDGTEVKALATGQAFRQVESLRLSDVWQGTRIRVSGTIHYRSLGVVENVSATGIEILDQNPSPSPDEIIDENFTGGLTSEAYLDELRRA